ncbi:MAG: molybdopterin cofactor-binding domain-containing protein [Candidatus Acidiferrales bacterium]
MSTSNLANAAAFDASRRDFLKSAAVATGAFLLGAYVSFPDAAGAQGGAPQGPYDPNFFLKIASDNTVTVISKHFEMGQGVTTGLATMVAEELNADWSTVRFEFATNDARLYNNLLFGPVMGTGGSSSMAESWEQMRKVGAAARMMLVAAAAAEWQVPDSEITVEKSVVTHARSGRKASFGQLAAPAMHMPVPKDVAVKPAQDWQLIGTKLPRLDTPGKTTGKAIFALDIHRPGMLTAVLKRPDRFGAKVASFDATEAKKIGGVVDVVQISTAVAVLANDTWSAIRGRDALKVTWDNSKAETRSTAEQLESYRHLAKQPGTPAPGRGDAAAGLKGAAKTVEAEYTFPYLAHAPMEPMNGTIELRSDGAEIWSGSQLQSIDQFVAAQVLGLKPEQVKINTLLGGGSFGRRACTVADWTAEMAEVVKAIHGRAPVHVVWTREDDIKGGFYRPMVLHRVKAGLDSGGEIAGWQHTIVSKSIFKGTPLEAMGVRNGIDNSMVEGVVDTPYEIGNLAIDVHYVDTPITVLWFRSVGHTHTAFVMETMLDDLAHRAGKDPVEFRLGLLAKDPRAAAVVKLAAEKSGWNGALPAGRARGLAFHHSFNTRVAMVAEVSAAHRALKVERITAAVDCGVAIDPDVVTAQIEGAIGFAMSIALRNQITFKDGVVEQSNFDDYEPTRMREMPKVEVHIVKSTEHPTGIGEPGVPPLAPAIANAVFAATGKRLRSLPLDLSELA